MKFSGPDTPTTLIGTVQERVKCKKTQAITFLTNFSPQYGKITSIFNKHLPMLNGHGNLRQILKTGVRFIPRKVCGFEKTKNLPRGEDQRKDSFIAKQTRIPLGLYLRTDILFQLH